MSDKTGQVIGIINVSEGTIARVSPTSEVEYLPPTPLNPSLLKSMDELITRMRQSLGMDVHVLSGPKTLEKWYHLLPPVSTWYPAGAMAYMDGV